jgi:hypothetical protein
VPALLKVSGVDVNQGIRDGDMKPLHYAAVHVDAEVVSWLVDKGAEVIGLLSFISGLTGFDTQHEPYGVVSFTPHYTILVD